MPPLARAVDEVARVGAGIPAATMAAAAEAAAAAAWQVWQPANRSGSEQSACKHCGSAGSDGGGSGGGWHWRHWRRRPAHRIAAASHACALSSACAPWLSSESPVPGAQGYCSGIALGALFASPAVAWRHRHLPPRDLMSDSGGSGGSGAGGSGAGGTGKSVGAGAAVRRCRLTSG